MKKLIFKILAVIVLSGTHVMAEVKLPSLLTSNMVLQRNKLTLIWGEANAGELISVSFRGQNVKTKASNDGNWKLKIFTGDAGGPFEMLIQGKNTILLQNILVGEVWICSGQSNMEWPLLQTNDGENAVNSADFPGIRFFQVHRNTSATPLTELLPSQWEICTPLTASSFSAAGYYFGKKIHTETGIPVGLISTNWGGTRIEPWISKESAVSDKMMAEWLMGLDEIDPEKLKEEQTRVFNIYNKELEKVRRNDFTHEYLTETYNDSEWTIATQPGIWEHLPGMEKFDGIVWFRKQVNIPDNFITDHAKLSLAKIDDSDITWINGIRVGETFFKYNLRREYDVPPGVLKNGNNILVVRIEDYGGGGGFYGDATEMYLTDGEISIDLSGEWKLVKDPTPTPMNPEILSHTVFMPNNFPSLLFNAMVNPLINYTIKGVIWYQGESNANTKMEALRYENLLRLMIKDWRRHWGIDDLALYIAQLASFRAETYTPQEDLWPYLRESQARLVSDPNVEMACIIDIGDANDIHPRNKKDVGERLALKALKYNYGKELVSEGPRYKSADFNGDRVIVSFDIQGSPLKTTNKYGYINGFTVAAGSGNKFHYAKAHLLNNYQVEVYSDKVDNIESVRFLWADNPGEVTLFNEAGLPAEPFRTDVTVENSIRIKPYDINPFYWQYKSKPVLLLGGTWQDNLFNHPVGLAEHLDLLVSVGGNYVRNTMSHRNIGNVFPYYQNSEGKFDLDKFNGEYWERFENFLKMTYARDIIVQIEIWDPWDLYANHQSFGGWSFHPFNPINNVNYNEKESGLPQEVSYNPSGQPTDHAFYRSIPELDYNKKLLAYQKKFVDKLLSYSLDYPNVLYCINNEIGENLHWGDFWAEHIRLRAKEGNVVVHVTDMRRNENIRKEDHNHIYDSPELYSYLDISQNNAWEGLGQKHYDNIMYVREYISNNPRPINNVKNYGSARHGEEESIARFWRIIFSGCASARFHRPHPMESPESHEASSDYGLGLSPRAQSTIHSMRMLMDKIDFVNTKPKNDLLADREPNEAYLLANEGKQYALYFPKDTSDGSVTIDITHTIGDWKLTWLNIDDSFWLDPERAFEGGRKIKIQKPDNGHWAAILSLFSHSVL